MLQALYKPEISNSFGKAMPIGMVTHFGTAPLLLVLVFGTGAMKAGQNADVFSPVQQFYPPGPSEPGFQQSLFAQFDDHSELSRTSILEEIAGYGASDEEAITTFLKEALSDEDALVSDAALRALVRQQVQSGKSLLSDADLNLFGGESADLARVQIAAANRDTGGLLQLLTDGDAAVQQSALDALASIDLDGAIEALRAELDDKKSLHRQQTLELLVRSPYTSGQDFLQPTLIEASHDADPLVRESARELLKSLGRAR
jgi:HEAT repeat protein